jgi:hypothetical protein
MSTQPLSHILAQDYTPLVSVYVQNPLVNQYLEVKTNKTADEVFAESDQFLSDRSTFWIRARNISLVSGVLSGVTCFGTIIAGCIPPYSVTAPIGAAMTVFPIFLIGLAVHQNSRILEIENYYLETHKSMRNFNDALEKFKLQPKQSEIETIFKLYLSIFVNLTNESANWYQTTGKLYLMEELTQMLPNTSEYYINWQNTKKHTFDNKIRGIVDKPWGDIGVENSPYSAYENFQENPYIKIEEKMLALSNDFFEQVKKEV